MEESMHGDERVLSFLDKLRAKSKLIDVNDEQKLSRKDKESGKLEDAEAVKELSEEEKKAARKKERALERKRRKQYRTPVWKVFLKALLYLFGLISIVLCVVVVAIAMYLAKETINDEELLDINSLKLSYATQFMAKDNETGEWYEYERIYGDENRVWTDYKEFPQCLIDATVASEDKTYFEHSGVDLKRTSSVMVDLALKSMGFPGLYSNTQGGSTITQQLIKNLTEEDSTDVPRKIREIYRAYQLETRFTKEQILEAYLNTFRLGGQVAGIEAGANHYFGVTTSELTAAQSAAIICITKAPVKNDPYLDAKENQYQREKVVLYLMHEQGLLTDDEYAAALKESAQFDFSQLNAGTRRMKSIYSWFTDTAIKSILQDFQDIKGLTEAEAYELLYKGGLRVYLTMDPMIQEVVEDVALNGYLYNNGRNKGFLRQKEYEKIPADELPLLDEDGELVLDENGIPVTVRPKKNQPQAAIVVMNFKGELMGVAGGIREKESSLCQNRAVDSTRQTGSTMKPLGAYSLGLEENVFTYSTGFMDSSDPVGGVSFKNYDGGYREGRVSMPEAIKVSLNTTAVCAVYEMGYEKTYEYLENSLGITSLDARDMGPGPLALGTLTHGISPYEMCAAYSVFGNDGTYHDPHCYTRIEDARGEVVLDKEAHIKHRYAVSPQTALMMNRMLQGVITGGTGRNARPNNTTLPYAGKTGTTSDWKDFWFIGMNPYYVCAVWEGYDEPIKMRTIEPKPTQLIFKEIMGRISENLPYKDFPTVNEVGGIVMRYYCRDSGFLASGGCPSAQGYYKIGHLPRGCNHEVDAATKKDEEEDELDVPKPKPPKPPKPPVEED